MALNQSHPQAVLQSAAKSLQLCCGSTQGGWLPWGWLPVAEGVQSPLLPGRLIGLKAHSAELQVAVT